ncbi:MAG: TRAP transporter small permease [Gammaproteobacteria bacterium]|nr:TRAP transporter small permease [Gammaproteobacteria bacterium]MYD77297.1 TRAP transporter small permease [Gammaproteobacteria bacterium]MYJ51875.1 TRAP transporter small permease [Gammaproteobacteria bacterium]
MYPSFLRKQLDRLYLLSGIAAAGFLFCILALIVLQMIARWTGMTFPGGPDYAGYCMAAASFLAFAYALNHGTHIRVSLFLNAMGRWRRAGEIWCHGVGALLSSLFAWYAIKAVRWSYVFEDISQGQDATPIWIPQMSMAVGSVILAICFWDHLFRLIFQQRKTVQAASDGRAAGSETWKS